MIQKEITMNRTRNVRLKAARALVNWRQIDLVNAVNDLNHPHVHISKTLLCQIETGRSIPDEMEKTLIAQVLDMPVEELFEE